MAKKCPECNGCTDIIWIEDRKRFFYCDFCHLYYDTIDGRLKLIPSKEVQELAMKIRKENSVSK